MNKYWLRLATLVFLSAPIAKGQVVAPKEVNATATSSSVVALSWTASTTSDATYNIYRSTVSKFTPGSVNPIKTGAVSPYQDTTVAASTTYYYIVEAVNAAVGTPGAAEAVQVNTPAAPATSNTSAGWTSLYTRAVAGVDVAAGSSLSTQTQAFLEFDLATPVPFQFNDRSKDPAWVAGRDCMQALNAASLALSSATGSGKALNQEQIKELVYEQVQKVRPACGEPPAEVKGNCKSKSKSNGANTTYATVLANEHVVDPHWSNLYCASTSQEFESAAQYVRRNYALDFSPISHRAWFWLNPRISSIPSQVSSLLSTVTTGSPSANSLLTAQYNQIVQDFELTGGVEFAPVGPRHWAALGDDARLGLFVIGGAGFTTPLSSTSANAQIFAIPTTPSTTVLSGLTALGVTNICGAPGVSATGCTSNVAFVPKDRRRFYYQDFFGLRLKTYYFKTAGSSGQFSGLCNTANAGQLCPIFPGTFDITVGQNSAYTGGQVRGWLLRTEAFYPLPFYPAIHVFFTAWVNVAGQRITTAPATPLLLNSASSSVTPTSPGVEVVTTPLLNRDYYRIGLGLDLVQFIKKLTPKPSNNKL